MCDQLSALPIWGRDVSRETSGPSGQLRSVQQVVDTLAVGSPGIIRAHTPVDNFPRIQDVIHRATHRVPAASSPISGCVGATSHKTNLSVLIQLLPGTYFRPPCRSDRAADCNTPCHDAFLHSVIMAHLAPGGLASLAPKETSDPSFRPSRPLAQPLSPADAPVLDLV